MNIQGHTKGVGLIVSIDLLVHVVDYSIKQISWSITVLDCKKVKYVSSQELMFI